MSFKSNQFLSFSFSWPRYSCSKKPAHMLLERQNSDVRKPPRATNYFKCLIFFLTSILMLVGLGLFGTIALIKFRYSHESINILDITVITIASLLCLISLIGYWGASQDSPFLLKLFIFSIVILTCLTILIDVVVFTHPGATQEILRDIWHDLNDHGRIEFQKIFLCCDISSNLTMNYLSSHDYSCFKTHTKSYATADIYYDPLRRQDCIKALLDFLHSYMNLISGIIGGIMLLNMVLVFLSCMVIINKTRVDPGEKKKYFSFPVVTDVILWKRRSRRLTEAIESGIFELPPTFPTVPIMQAYKNSLDKSVNI